MKNLKDFRVLGFLTITLLNIMQSSSQLPMEPQEEESPEVKTCLLECMTCKEFWGSIYDGHACANRCFGTEGKDIDLGCRRGASISKRYAEIRLTDQCKKQCEVCAMKYSSHNYDRSKCLETCGITIGKDRDPACTKFLTLYKILGASKLI